jgi:hypothetical protein
VEYFNYFDSIVSNDARSTHKIKSRIVKSSFQQEEEFFTSKLDRILRKKLEKCYTLTVAFCGAET